MFKKTFFLITLFFCTKSNTQNKSLNNLKGCNNTVSKEHIINLDNLVITSIEVDTHDYRKWIVNSIRILTSGTRFIL